MEERIACSRPLSGWPEEPAVLRAIQLHLGAPTRLLTCGESAAVLPLFNADLLETARMPEREGGVPAGHTSK